MARPLWYNKKWGRAKALVQEINEDYNMSNKEIQNKIIEILENKTEK